MNRSFQSIAALLVSLSGAMLAVTWIPADGLRRPYLSDSARRRTATVPCGYVTGRSVASEVEPPSLPQRAADTLTQGEQLAPWTPVAPWLAECCREAPVCAAAAADSRAAKTVRDAFGLFLRLPSSVCRDSSLAGPQERDLPRQHTEAEYAAAELAAAAPPRRSVVSAALQRSAIAVQDAMQELKGPVWLSISKKSSDVLEKKYNEVVTYYGWQEVASALAADALRQQRRLALREALLRDLNERFLDIREERDIPNPEKPQFHPQHRKILLAAAEALKSLSQALNAAAEELEVASRRDVAELHTPLQNKEEKR